MQHADVENNLKVLHAGLELPTIRNPKDEYEVGDIKTKYSNAKKEYIRDKYGQ